MLSVTADRSVVFSANETDHHDIPTTPILPDTCNKGAIIVAVPQFPVFCCVSTCFLRVNIVLYRTSLWGTVPIFKGESMEYNIGQYKIFETHRNCSTR